jgi:acetyl-CoA/propionyl-CoA carboxylase carboxyl transferase subunit
MCRDVGDEVDQPQRAYDMRPLVREIIDVDHHGASVFEELQAKWAPNIIVGLDQLGRRNFDI